MINVRVNPTLFEFYCKFKFNCNIYVNGKRHVIKMRMVHSFSDQPSMALNVNFMQKAVIFLHNNYDIAIL